MAKKFLTAIDLAKNEFQNGVAHNLAAAPSSPAKGQLYMNTSDNTLYWWDGTAWASARGGGTGFPGFGASTATTTFGLSKSDGVGTTTARNDHTHGTPAHLAADHSTFPLNTFAVPTADISMGGFKLTNLGGVSSAQDAATKSYVDSVAAGTSWKDSVRCATTGNITLSGLQTIDGVTVVAVDRVLVKNQSTPSQNGVYNASSTSWTRPPDVGTGTIDSAAVFVSEGTTQADTAWVMTTNPPITIGTTAINWVQFGAGATYVGGAGLSLTGTTFDVGAGTGITVAADTVALDTAYTDGRYALAAAGSKRFATSVGGATTAAVAHNLNTRDVVVNVYRVASPYDTVECDVERTDANNVTLRFAVAPAASEYRAVVVG